MSHIINYNAKNVFKLKFTAIAKQCYQCFNTPPPFFFLKLTITPKKYNTNWALPLQRSPPPFFFYLKFVINKVNPFLILNSIIWINIWNFFYGRQIEQSLQSKRHHIKWNNYIVNLGPTRDCIIVSPFHVNSNKFKKKFLFSIITVYCVIL